MGFSNHATSAAQVQVQACNAEYSIVLLLCDNAFFIDAVLCDNAFFIDSVLCDNAFFIDSMLCDKAIFIRVNVLTYITVVVYTGKALAFIPLEVLTKLV